jgi:UDP-N-acetyl-D-glucosamine dehydrogenase
LDDDVLDAQDAVVVVTDHGTVDYEHVRERARLVVDTRGVYRRLAPNVVPA